MRYSEVDRPLDRDPFDADPDLGDEIAAATETPYEMEIDAINGLHGHGGRRPRPEDFADVLVPEGNSGDVAGSEVGDPLISIGGDPTL
jgi:hypothetical protein